MAHVVSPLAPESFPELPPIAGVALAAAETGIRYKNRPDVLASLFQVIDMQYGIRPGMRGCERLIEVGHEKVVEIGRHPAAVVPAIADHLPLRRNNLDIGALEKAIKEYEKAQAGKAA